MVKLISAILLMALPLLSYAGSLEIVLDSTEVQIGKPIHARIIATDINKKISSVNINGLKKNFGLNIIESSNIIENSALIQKLEVNLYPRSTGFLKIPSIVFDNYKTKPIELFITDATGNDGTISFKTMHSDANVWQRQKIIISIEIITPSKFSHIELTPIDHPNIESYIIKPTQVKLSNGLYKIVSGWHLYPLLEGDILLSPPSVRYRLNGKTQRKFYPSSINIKTRRLPSYIPPLMPVGNIVINDKKVTDNIWSIEFSSPDVSPSTLLSMSLPIKVIDGIKFGDRVSVKLTDDTISHRIPLIIDTSGIYTIPEIIYKHFNPNTGKIIASTIPRKRIIFLNTWLKIALVLLAVFLLYKSLSALLKFTIELARQHKNKKIIVKSVLAAKSPYELHRLLNKYAEVSQWGNNLPLTKWSAIWDQHKGTSAKEIINELSLACYTKDFNMTEQSRLNRKIHDFIKA